MATSPKQYPTLQDLADLRRRRIDALETQGRRFRHQRNGKLYYVRDVVLLHTGRNPGLSMAYTYCEVTPLGQEVPFVQDCREFHRKFERNDDDDKG